MIGKYKKNFRKLIVKEISPRNQNDAKPFGAYSSFTFWFPAEIHSVEKENKFCYSRCGESK